MHFNIRINAPAEKVWDILWKDETYRQWTGVFSEGSYAESDWQEGGRILFLNGEGSGMYSTIDKKEPHKFMSFKHLGEFKNGREQPIDEAAKTWSGSFENYTLTEQNGSTELKVDIEVGENDKDMFHDTFPQGLQKVKELAEK